MLLVETIMVAVVALAAPMAAVAKDQAKADITIFMVVIMVAVVVALVPVMEADLAERALFVSSGEQDVHSLLH